MNPSRTVPSEETPASLGEILREGGRALLLVALLAALVRTCYSVAFFTSHPLADTLLSDARLYHEWALTILDTGPLGDTEPYHHPPLYPHVLAILYAVAGPHPAVAVVFQHACGLMSLLLAYALARRLAGKRAALLAAVLATLYLPPVLFETRLLPATLATLLAAAFLYTASHPRPDAARRLVSGVLLGLLAAARPNQLLAIAATAPVIALRDDRGKWSRAGATGRLALFLVGAAAPIAPFFLRNALHAGEPVLLCDTGGINLYFAHHDDAAASFRTTRMELGDVDRQPEVSRAMAERAEGRSLSHSEVSRHFARRALAWAVEHPLREAALLWKKMLALFDSREYGIVYPVEAERYLLWPGRVLLVPFALLASLAVFGLIASRTRERRAPGWWEAAAFLVAQSLTVWLFFQYSRFRVVSLPAVTAFVSLGIAMALRARAGAVPPLRLVSAGVAAALACVPSLLPPDRAALEQEASGHVVLAETLAARGEFDRALRHADAAVALAPGMARAELARIAALEAGGRTVEALAAAERLAPGDQGHPLVLAAIARLLAEDGASRDLPRALRVATAAVDAAPGLPEARLALARVHMALGDAEQAARAVEPLLGGNDLEPRLIAAWAYLELGRPERVLAVLERAANAHSRHPFVWSCLARAYEALGRREEAAAARARWNALDPSRSIRR